MKDFVEKYFSTILFYQKNLTGVSKNGEKKWFSLAGEPVSPTMNKLPLAGIFF